MMTVLERYELILTQGISELPPYAVAAPQEAAALGAAEELGDLFFRLTLEHGVPFGPFRETVMGILLEEAESEDATRFAPELEDQHGLILLALEMMPAEVDF